MTDKAVVLDEGAQVGHEAVPTGDELVQLAAAREVLVVEDAPSPSLPNNSASSAARAGFTREEELGQPAEAVVEVRRR